MVLRQPKSLLNGIITAEAFYSNSACIWLLSGILTFVSPPIQTSVSALQRQMSSRWFCFWKRSGPPDCNLNKYAIHVGNASGVRGSAGYKQRRDSVEMGWGIRTGWGETRKDKQVMFGAHLQMLFWSKWSLSEPWCWNKTAITAPDGTTGNKVFANKISHSYIMSHSRVLAPNYTQITLCWVPLLRWDVAKVFRA